VALAIGAVTAAVHRPVLDCQALGSDDLYYLVRNSLVPNPSWASVKQVFSEVLRSSVVPGYYHPLGVLSLMVDCAVGGDETHLRPFRVTSLALHAANASLMFILLQRIFGSFGPAAIGALLLGLHPMTVEPVSWLGERKTLLAEFFALLMLIVYVEYSRRHGRAEQGSIACRSRKWLWQTAIAVLYILSILSKPTTVMLPVLLALLDVWPLRRFGRCSVLEKIPLLVIMVGSAVLTFLSHQTLAATASPQRQGVVQMVQLVLHNLTLYFQHLFAPGESAFFHDLPEPFGFEQPRVLAGAVLAVILAPALVLSLRWTPAILVGVAFFVIAVLPAGGVVRVTRAIAGDRHVYFPMMGLLLIIAAAVARVLRQPVVIRARMAGIAVVAAALCACVYEAHATHRNYEAWRTTESLYRRMLAHNADSPQANFNLAHVLTKLGKRDEAVIRFQEGLRLFDATEKTAIASTNDPFRADLAAEASKARNNVALMTHEKTRPGETVDEFARAVKQDPGNFNARNNYGASLARAGRFEEAAAQFKAALDVQPGFVTAWVNLARVLFQLGRFEEAGQALSEAAQREPRTLKAFVQFGGNLELRGKRDTAIAVYQAVLRVSPDMPEARMKLDTLQRLP
jgi:tetratricopeptide (TPR) repeat protein